jgi:hypothetical protein
MMKTMISGDRREPLVGCATAGWPFGGAPVQEAAKQAVDS